MNSVEREFKDMSDGKFVPNLYQAYIAAMAIAADKKFVNMTIPSGQGKSFIILLLARYYLDQVTGINTVVIFSKDEVTHNQFREY